MSGHGGTGRRVRLRGVWATIRVQVPVTAPRRRSKAICSDFLFKKSSPYRLLLLFRQNTVLTSSSFGFFILVVFFYCFRDFKLLRNLTATQFFIYPYLSSPKQVSAKKEKQAEKANAFRLQIFKWDLFSRIGHKSQIFKMHF